MSRTRYKYFENNTPYFVTCTTVNWLPIFGQTEIASIILDSLLFLQKQKRMVVHAYVLMENHLHLIALAEDLSREVAAFKSFTARKIIDFLQTTGRTWYLHQLKFYKLQHKDDRDYQVWQEGSHPEQIISLDMLLKKLEYIHFNPVKRGYVDMPEHWRYSSARDYLGESGILPITVIDPW